jgi:hypothetical protein
MMGDTWKPSQKKPGERPLGKSGKTIEIVKDKTEQENNVDRIQSRDNTRKRE